MQKTTCELCPRKCYRSESNPGFCGAKEWAQVALSLLHFWEEPPISGTKGSGTVFFSGCNLRCVYCQNHLISVPKKNKNATIKTFSQEIKPADLSQIFFDLAAQGAHNINLVTPTPHIHQIRQALIIAKQAGLTLPVIYNSSAYENVAALRSLDGLIDVYLPDLKYINEAVAINYSQAPGYWPTASRAVLEMARQVNAITNKSFILDEQGLLKKGLLIRHLILPGLRKDSMLILDWIANNLPKDTPVSLLAQYFPTHQAHLYQQINRKITAFEYNSIIEHFFSCGLTTGYMQKREAAQHNYVPDFSSQ
ncbi:MAG: radical SAM protein [Firmicutes bacterium]|nr:radical SAM protein [Bacillota bacterium]